MQAFVAANQNSNAVQPRALEEALGIDGMVSSPLKS